jgi:diguanylate cyclase (GGDEF)-like protein
MADADPHANMTATWKASSYALTGIALFSLFWLVRDSDWEGSRDLHTIMEVIATMLAFGVGVLGFVRYATKPDNTILFVSAAFMGTAFLDGYHAVVTSQWFDILWPSPPPQLIPWSWNASRSFLAVMMCLSLLAWRREIRLGPQGAVSPKWVSSSVVLLTLTSFLFFAFVPLPRAYYPELAFGRPQEFFSATLFLLAMIGYLAKGYWKTDAFEHWVVLSLIVGFVSQAAFMSNSFHLYDTMFDMAHLLKKASYICVLTGLLVSIVHVLMQAERDRKALDELNAELIRKRATAEELARTDPLTGLNNRRAFHDLASVIVEQSRRHDRSYSLVVLDVDYFKRVNDTHGHGFGDKVLVKVAQIIADQARRSDVSARIGGEEFALIMPDTQSGEAARLAERLRRAIEDLVIASQQGRLRITASFGVAERGHGNEPLDSVIRRADKALYFAKGEGRNRVIVDAVP